jgi:formate dehydrogenase
MNDRTLLPETPADGGAKRVRATAKGRVADPAALEQVGALLANEPRRRDLLIEHLHKIQDAYGHLSADHLAALAKEMNLPLAEIYEVATFYHHFDVVREGEAAPPKVTVRVCDSLSCEMAGAQNLMAKLRSLVGPDVRVIPAPCVGRCAAAPVAIVGQKPFERAQADSVAAAARRGEVRDTPPKAIPYKQYRAQGGYRLLAECLAGRQDPEKLMKAMEDSGLRGLGGAGFPTGRKWRIVRAEPAPRLMAINIDEGEPGTFKDRHYLERDPHRFLEGALIAAWVCQVAEVYIYLRDEYHGCRELLERELQALLKAPPCALPPIQLRRGAGAYICGEESAMIESIEGKRGMPRLRPPYVAQVGLFGHPTLEHNFETLYWVRDILEKGVAWYTSHGRHGRTGLRSFSVSGRVKEPGVKLAPAGITARELIDDFCGGMADGHKFYGYLPGGASGGILPASMGGIPLDFGTLESHGCFIGSMAVVILSDQDRARDAARNLVGFFKHESCGQCTPCRVGTAKALPLLEKPVWDVPLLEELSRAMADASICGLGQAAPNPVRSVIRFFRHEIDA